MFFVAITSLHNRHYEFLAERYRLGQRGRPRRIVNPMQTISNDTIGTPNSILSLQVFITMTLPSHNYDFRQ